MSTSCVQCVICSERVSNGYNYGVLTCNACKTFFKRVLTRNDVPECRRGKSCTVNCEYCRFQKCIQSGMTYLPSEASYDLKNNELVLSSLLTNLSYLNLHKNHFFVNYFFEGDPSISEIARLTGSLKFTEHSENTALRYLDWGFISGLTSIEYLKKMNFLNALCSEDRETMLKDSFIQFCLFAIAQDIPAHVYGISSKSTNKIQGKLVARLIELNVTKEEFLLLSVLLSCKPAFGLTDHGANLIDSFRRSHSSALFQHCLLTHQGSGPARFADLLFLHHLICGTYEDVVNHYQLRLYCREDSHFKRIMLSESDCSEEQ